MRAFQQPDGENGAVASVSKMTELNTSNRPTVSGSALQLTSHNTVPPAGALAHVLDAGLLTVTAAVLLELLYVAVIVEDPAATPVTGILADS